MIAIFFFLFSFQSSVISWWCTGHMLVAQIALNNINVSSSSDMCIELVLKMQEFTTSSTFTTSACWADDLKGNNVHEFDNWHFINQGWNNNTNVSFPPIPDDTIVSEIRRIMNSLNSSQSSIWSKAMLFRFLVHLVGDIHQPLHCINLYNHQFPNGDIGGNNFIVFFQNMSKLHSIWDSGIGLYANDILRPFNALRTLDLENLAKNISQEYPEEFFNGSTKELNPDIWKIDSYNKAIKYAYSNLVNGTTLEQNSTYVKVSRQIVRQQIALAGYRLAHMINTIPIVSVRTPLTNSQLIGIVVAILLLGMIIGGLISFIVMHVKHSRGEYKIIN